MSVKATPLFRKKRTVTKHVIEISKKEYLDAVTEGIRAGVSDCLPPATLWVKQLEATLKEYMPEPETIIDAICEGICRSFPDEEDLADAIMRRKRSEEEKTEDGMRRVREGWKPVHPAEKVERAKARESG